MRAVNPGRALVAGVLAASCLALIAPRADAAYTPTIAKGTLVVTGDAASDALTLRVPASNPSGLELDMGDDGTTDFRIARARFNQIRVLAGGGDDKVRVDDGLVALGDSTPITIDGQGGADTLLGGQGAETLVGGDGNDVVDPAHGDDTVLLGPGNDQSSWDPGDGNDRLEGDGGFDRLTFDGSGADEQMRLVAGGGRSRLTRDVGGVSVDMGGVERVDVTPLGGKDTLTVDELTTAGVQEVGADLAAVKGGTSPDPATDRVVLNGTAAADVVNLIGGGAGPITAVGLPAVVSVSNSSPANDELNVNTLAGNDRVEAQGATAVKLVEDGGAGNDSLFGGAAVDTLIGGDGNDFASGRKGQDVVLLGSGDDVFDWDAGDGSDTLFGGTGNDEVRLSGNASGEQFALSAVGLRVHAARAVGSAAAEVVDFDDVENLALFSFGGADTIRVDDLSGTDLAVVDASLFDFAVPGGDLDVVIVNGTAGDDTITAAGAPGKVDVTGLSPRLSVTGTAAAGDRLEVNGRAGDDTIDSTDLPADKMQFRADGGDDNDVMLGGAGDDVLFAGAGADVVFAGGGDNVAFGGAGDDILRGEEGDDFLDGGAGDDILIGNAGDDVLLNGEVVFDS